MKSFPLATRVSGGGGVSCLLPQVGITFTYLRFSVSWCSSSVSHFPYFFFFRATFFFLALILFFVHQSLLFLSDYYLLSALAIITIFFFFFPSFKLPMFDNRSFPKKEKKKEKKPQPSLPPFFFFLEKSLIQPNKHN